MEANELNKQGEDCIMIPTTAQCATNKVEYHHSPPPQKKNNCFSLKKEIFIVLQIFVLKFGLKADFEGVVLIFFI